MYKLSPATLIKRLNLGYEIRSKRLIAHEQSESLVYGQGIATLKADIHSIF